MKTVKDLIADLKTYDENLLVRFAIADGTEFVIGASYPIYKTKDNILWFDLYVDESSTSGITTEGILKQQGLL